MRRREQERNIGRGERAPGGKGLSSAHRGALSVYALLSQSGRLHLKWVCLHRKSMGPRAVHSMASLGRRLSTSRGGSTSGSGGIQRRQVGADGMRLKGGERKRRRSGDEARGGVESGTQSLPGPESAVGGEGAQAHAQAQTGRDREEEREAYHSEGAAIEGEQEAEKEEAGEAEGDQERNGVHSEGVSEEQERTWASLPPTPYTADQVSVQNKTLTDGKPSSWCRAHEGSCTGCIQLSVFQI